MKLTSEQKDAARAILQSNDESFLHLLRVAGLDPARVLPGADLRGVVFTPDDDLTGMDLSGCDLRGADLTLARGVDHAKLLEVISDPQTKGLPPPGPPTAFDILRARHMLLQGEVPPRLWRPFIFDLEFDGLELTSGLAPVGCIPALQRLSYLYEPRNQHGFYSARWRERHPRKRIQDLWPLAQLKALRHLFLDGVNVSDLDALKDLVELETLVIRDSSITSIRALSVLPKLRDLCLDYSLVSDLTPLAQSAGLQSLRLRRSRVSDLRPISRLTNLHYLDVNGTQVADLGPLSELTHLQVLELGNTKVANLTPLKNLHGLRSIDLFGTIMSDLNPLQNLRSLQRISPTHGRWGKPARKPSSEDQNPSSGVLC
jgi:hypothetical protein